MASDKSSIKVKWCPLIKGFYKVAFNGFYTKNYNICVIANQLSKTATKLDIPDINLMHYHEKFNIVMHYRYTLLSLI